ncbi:probable ubiquitin-conjugating enzyme E2 23 [Solanum lycopersicum]|uniref:probable ubiquitin-conjugating enzyme E2 23 n=1 Tax=Solanum lycopersicum TaxID=4081 RepID=UPI0002765C1D|nr:probable ubiquitin-conjugating enzyme E2 24 [Solanum lycopersicum]
MEDKDNADLDSQSGLEFDNNSDSDDVFDYFRMTKEDFDDASGRRFIHGDIVSSMSNPDNKLGQVVQINRFFGMFDSDDLYSFRDIPSNQLKRITKFAKGDLVVLTHWLGRVVYVSCDTTVKFENDDSLRTFRGGTGLYPRFPSWNISCDRPCPLHPGQQVMVAGKPCTVIDLVDRFVYVEWIANSECSGSPPPPDKQDPNSLTQVFSYLSTWKIGDVCKHVSYPEIVVLITDIRTFVDVSWQDGSTERNIPSTLLKPISDIGVHDFLVDQYVVWDNSEHLGVVKSVDHREKTTTVKWINRLNEDIISSSRLNRHHLFNYHLGNLVFRRITKEAENSDLSSFGSIIGFKDGNIEVAWDDGTTSMVQPQELHGVDRDDYGYKSDEYSSSSDEEVGDSLVVEIPDSNVDLLDFVDLQSVKCLNECHIHCISNALEKDYREFKGLNVESTADEQLLIYIPFKQPINLHSLIIGGLVEEGPKTVKLLANKTHFDVSDAIEATPRDAAILSEDNLRGKAVKLKQVKFQSVHSVTIFIEDNQYGSKLTRVQRIYLFGTSHF